MNIYDDKLLTLKQFCLKHPAFTMGSMRNKIFNRDINGLEESGAILRDGYRILIDEDRFLNWVRERKNK